MSVIIVGGPAGAGKSTFIKEHFSDKTVIDLKDFQDKYRFLSYDNVVKSYEDCKEALVNAIKEGKDVVMEHTLLRAIRRDVYIKAIKEVTNDDIVIYFFKPSMNLLAKRIEHRSGASGERSARVSLETLEVPTYDEGYTKIYIIKDDDVIEQVKTEETIKQFLASVVTGDDELATKTFKSLLENEPENIPDNFLEFLSECVRTLKDAEEKNKVMELANSWINY